MATQHERAQSAAELAVLLPILLLIVLGCLDLGRAFSIRMALVNGTREGARIGSLYPGGYPDPVTGTIVVPIDPLVRERTTRDIQAQGVEVDESKLQINFDLGLPVMRGNPISVTASYELQLFTGYLFGAKPVVIKATSQMAIVGEP